MDRAYSAGAIGTPPTAPVSPSIGYPTSGNPGSGVAATRPGPYWFHMITEELRALIVAAGLTPAQGTLNQVLLSIQALISAAPVVPIGTLLWVPSTVAPPGYLKANGALISRATYTALWTHAQTTGNVTANDGAWSVATPGSFSPGDGSTTFRLPDLRGLFVRSFHDGSTSYESDLGRALGSYQADDNKSHTHTESGFVGGVGYGQGTSLAAGSPTTGASGGAEARPRNVALLAVIRY